MTAVNCNTMNDPLLLFLIPFSFLIALFIDSIVETRLSKIFIITVIAVCLLLISPLIFTDYTYGDLYPNVLIIAIVLILINFLWMKYTARKVKITMAIVLCVLTFIPTFLMYFGRAFVGEPKIYNTESIKNYKIRYLREASPGIQDPPKVELYRTKIFGLLQKLVDIEYEGGDSTCDIALRDDLNSVVIIYNTCEEKISIK